MDQIILSTKFEAERTIKSPANQKEIEKKKEKKIRNRF